MKDVSLQSKRTSNVQLLPSLLNFPDNDREAQTHVNTLAQAVEKSNGSLKYEDCAIILRTHSLFRVFEDYLTRQGVPYVTVGATSFYEREEVRDLIAYLHLIVNPKDDESFMRIVNVPGRKIGSKTLNALNDHAQSQGISLFEASVSPQFFHKLKSFIEIINSFRSFTQRLSPQMVLNQLIQKIQYTAYLQKKHKDDYEMRVENVSEFVNVAAQSRFMTSESLIENLSALLEEIATMQAASKPLDGSERKGVTLTTYHSAKGLEFEMVILPGLVLERMI